MWVKNMSYRFALSAIVPIIAYPRRNINPQTANQDHWWKLCDRRRATNSSTSMQCRRKAPGIPRACLEPLSCWKRMMPREFFLQKIISRALWPNSSLSRVPGFQGSRIYKLVLNGLHAWYASPGPEIESQQCVFQNLTGCSTFVSLSLMDASHIWSNQIHVFWETTDDKRSLAGGCPGFHRVHREGESMPLGAMAKMIKMMFVGTTYQSYHSPMSIYVYPFFMELVLLCVVDDLKYLNVPSVPSTKVGSALDGHQLNQIT